MRPEMEAIDPLQPLGTATITLRSNARHHSNNYKR